MKRQQWTKGAIISIDLEDGTYGFGQILDASGTIGFFDIRSQSPKPDLGLFVGRPYLFSVWVMRYAVTQGDFLKIGKTPIDEDYVKGLKFFMQDIVSGKLSIYDHRNPIPATFEEVVGMERAAAWESHHVAERLRNHFAGVQDPMTERLRPKHN